MEGVSMRSSAEQFSIMIAFMERHGDLLKAAYSPKVRRKRESLWAELARQLNSVRFGITKPQGKWKRVWSDWKAKTKRKARACLISGKQLSPLERRVVAVMKRSSVTRTPILSNVRIELEEELPQQTDHQYNVEVNAEVDHNPLDIKGERPDTPEQDYMEEEMLEEFLDPPEHISAFEITSQQERKAPSPSPLPKLPHRPQPRFRQIKVNRSELSAFELYRLKIEKKKMELESQRLEIERERIKVEAHRVRVEEMRVERDKLLNDKIDQLYGCVQQLLQAVPQLNRVNGQNVRERMLANR